jgi:hypothetical protein
LDHDDAGRLLTFPRITGDELGLSSDADRGGVGKELTPSVQHLLGKRQRRPQEPVEVVLRLLGC